MSSEDEEYDFGAVELGSESVVAGTRIKIGDKRRRITRACDICRKKKIKCDSASMPGGRCTNCLLFDSECTHVEPAKKRGPKGQAQALQQRLNRMELLLRKLRPDIDVTEELARLNSTDLRTTTSISKQSSDPSSSATLANIAPQLAETESSSVESEQEHDVALNATMESLQIDVDQSRYFGQSSGFMFMKQALGVKKEYTRTSDETFSTSTAISQWELDDAQESAPSYEYPEYGLMRDLINLFFQRTHHFLPFIHRPSFEKDFANNLHLRDRFFGAMVLCMCAVSSRYSDDPRVLVDGQNLRSCGWQWFKQVGIIRRSLLRTATLHEVQYYTLAAMYVQGTSSPQAVWTLAGIGIRFAQEKGVHRLRSKGRHWTPEDEQWKRCFWTLLLLDRIICSFLGRPSAVHSEDYDLDLPRAVDDDYWENEDPLKAWKQPPGKHSHVEYFINSLKLSDILAFILRTIYPVNRSRITVDESDYNLVLKIDNALNHWVDELPSQLKWDAHNPNIMLFNHSAALYLQYYYVQIQLHRSYIPMVVKDSSLSSLAICANAARSCSHIAKVLLERRPLFIPYLQMSVYTAGIVLLINIWGGVRSSLAIDPAKEMEDVGCCIRYLRYCEQRWHIAGRFRDMLDHLAAAGDLPLPRSSPPAPKRVRPTQEPSRNTYEPVSNSVQFNPVEDSRPIAGSNRVNSMPIYDQSTKPIVATPQAHPAAVGAYSLPMYGEHLGRLPVHGSVNLAQYQAPVYNFQPRSSDFRSTPPGALNVQSISSHSESSSSDHDQDYNSYREFLNAVHPTSSTRDTMTGQEANNYGGYNSQHGTHVSGHQPYNPSGTESSLVNMWQNAPNTFSLQDWDSYVSGSSGDWHSNTQTHRYRPDIHWQ